MRGAAARSHGHGAFAQRGRRRSGWLRWLVLVTPSLVTIGACERPNYTYSDDVPIANGASSSTAGTSFGTGPIGGTAPADMCLLERVANGSPIFSKQTVSNALPAHPDLYLEVTDAEAAAMRNGAPLIPAPAVGTSNSTLTSVLNQALTTAGDDARQRLVQQLLLRFKSTRSTWPNPWALRLVDHPGTEHMNPVRIRLKPAARIVSIKDALPFEVVDVQNAQVSISDAALHPERIAAVYYVANTKTLSLADGTPCDTGKRELVLGNAAMVDSFELGTPEILERMNSDIDALNAFFKLSRACSKFDQIGTTFQAYTACQVWEYFDPSREYSAYQWSLSSPVELYKPTPQNLDTLVQALQEDLFEPDPFVGVPAPVVGAGGETGAGGAAGAAGDASSQGGI